MAGVNKAILVGNLGADPEIRTGATGHKVATFSLATGETWKDKNTGDRKERTEWHRVVVFAEGLVEIVEKYLKKGSRAYVEGAIATRKWTDNGGVERYSTEIVLQVFRGVIVLLDRVERAPGASSPDDCGQSAGAPARGKPDMNDEIPF